MGGRNSYLRTVLAWSRMVAAGLVGGTVPPLASDRVGALWLAQVPEGDAVPHAYGRPLARHEAPDV